MGFPPRGRAARLLRATREASSHQEEEDAMADETKESQGIDWRRTFAFLEIDRKSVV